MYDALPANLRKRKAYAPLLADGPRLFDGPVACGPIVGAAESFVAWLKQQNRKFAALEMESGGVLAAVFEATDPARTLVLRGISDLADHRKPDLDQTADGVFRRVAMNNAIGLLDAMLAASCLPRAHVGESLQDSHPVSERPGYVTTLRLTQTGDQVHAVLEEPGQPSLRAHAEFRFTLTPQDDEDLRWYLEDFLQHPFEPAPTIAARIEAQMAEIGGQLFGRVFGRTTWSASTVTACTPKWPTGRRSPSGCGIWVNCCCPDPAPAATDTCCLRTHRPRTTCNWSTARRWAGC